MGTTVSTPVTSGSVPAKLFVESFSNQDRNDRPSTPLSQKKKMNRGSLLASTIRRHIFIRRVKPCVKNSKHAKAFREFISKWPTAGLLQLVSQYECVATLRELHLLAECARPSVPSVREDLADLLRESSCADTYLQFDDRVFAVHKAIVCSRCPLFRELLGKVYTYGAQVPLNLPVPGLSAEHLERMLSYLYAGRLSGELPDELRMLVQQHVPNELDHDLAHLLDIGLYSDATLVFMNGASPCSPDMEDPCAMTNTLVNQCKACNVQAEYSCHMAILSARSRFFRNAITRQLGRLTNGQAGAVRLFDTSKRKLRIVLDERHVPRRYARILLHCMYRDACDLLPLLPSSMCQCDLLTRGSLNSTGTTVSCLGAAGRSNGSSSTSLFSLSSESDNIQEAAVPAKFIGELFELYHLGRLLEVGTLSACAEDLLIDALCPDTLLPILRWSRDNHGSAYVRRQAIQYARDEFTQLISGSHLLQLRRDELLELLKSEFTQASEMELLQMTVRWGENQLLQKMQKTEPNLISQTAHSLRRSASRQSELNDEQLKVLLEPLLAYVNIQHLLPVPNDCKTDLIRRGLLPLPTDTNNDDCNDGKWPASIHDWLLNGKSQVRFYLPFFEEAKSLLEERVGRPGEMIATATHRPAYRSLSHSNADYLLDSSKCVQSQMPDTLYMLNRSWANETLPSLDVTNPAISPVNEIVQLTRSCSLNSSITPPLHPRDERCISHSSLNSVSRDPTANQEQLDALTRLHLRSLSAERLAAMFHQEQELRNCAMANRHLQSLEDKEQLLRLIALRVVREFGLDDFVIKVFRFGAHALNAEAIDTNSPITEDDTALDEMDDSVFALSSLSRTVNAARRARQPDQSNNTAYLDVFDDALQV